MDPSSGVATVVGLTTSADFPLARAVQDTLSGTQDGFVTRLSADGSALDYSTYLGGDATDALYSVAVDATGGATVAGVSTSSSGAITNPQQFRAGGDSDAYVAHLNDNVATTTVFNRSVQYAYDNVDRLTGATESGATTGSFVYGYDKAGNRTRVTANGTTTTRSYDNANQISTLGYTYDAAGNQTSDGSTSYTYDALSRLTGQGAASYGYNGDGVLTVRSIAGSTQQYVQDLASPLPQVLQADPDSHEIYGLERLAHVEMPSNGQTWYGTDALGSVRQTLDAHGAAQNATWYDPWGTVQNTSFSSFGFTGELSDGNVQYLCARWYNPSNGAFQSVDPFAGDAATPYSQHPYAYTWSNSVNLTDASGRDPWWYESPYATTTVRPSSSAVDFEERDRRCHERDYFETRMGRTPGACDANVLFEHPHESLAALGLIPPLTVPAAILDTTLYCAEGDFEGAAISGLGTARFLHEIAIAARLARSSATSQQLSVEIRKTADFLESEGGHLGGQFYGAERLAHLKRFLDQRKVDLILDDPRLGPNRGAFLVDEQGRPQLLLRNDATEFDVWHELSHYIHYRRIGRDAYLNLQRRPNYNEAEIEGYEILIRSEHFQRLNIEEKLRALVYFEEKGGVR